MRDQNRSPLFRPLRGRQLKEAYWLVAAGFAWLLIAVFWPVAGAIIFLLFGFTTFLRMTPGEKMDHRAQTSVFNRKPAVRLTRYVCYAFVVYLAVQLLWDYLSNNGAA